jgi:hypothetical protein
LLRGRSPVGAYFLHDARQVFHPSHVLATFHFRSETVFTEPVTFVFERIVYLAPVFLGKTDHFLPPTYKAALLAFYSEAAWHEQARAFV